MISSNLIHSLLKRADVQKGNTISFKPGQVFQAKVLKLFPNNVASVQAGTVRFVAHLETALQSYKSYWFRVQSTKDQIHIKVLNEIDGNNAKGDIKNSEAVRQLLSQFSLPQTNRNIELIQKLITENIPLSKDLVAKALQFLKPSDLSNGLNALKTIVNKDLPVTREIFNAMLTAQTEIPLSADLTKLYETLSNTQLHSESVGKLKQQIANIIEISSHSETWNSGEEITRTLKQIISSLGLQLERNVATLGNKTPSMQDIERFETLKPLLLKVLQELNDPSIKSAVETVANRLTGQQLLSVDHNQIQQLILQIPIYIGNKLTDLTMQWTGKKGRKDEFDPNHCRILFYLELENIKDTIIDVQIQNRVTNIIVINDAPELERIITFMKPALIESLNKLQYKLSSIKVVHPDEKKELPATCSKSLQSGYDGVDLRI